MSASAPGGLGVEREIARRRSRRKKLAESTRGAGKKVEAVGIMVV